MPTIQLARDREMPRGIHAAIVVSAFLAAYWMLFFLGIVGGPILSLGFGRNPEVWVPGAVAFAGFIGLVFLVLALGLHGERRWARPLAVLATLAWLGLTLRDETFYANYQDATTPDGRAHATVANLRRIVRLLPTIASAAWAVWYFYGRRRTRDYYRALTNFPRNPTIAPSATSGPGTAPPPAFQT
jgi:hypothetical protein